MVLGLRCGFLHKYNRGVRVDTFPRLVPVSEPMFCFFNYYFKKIIYDPDNSPPPPISKLKEANIDFFKILFKVCYQHRCISIKVPILYPTENKKYVFYSKLIQDSRRKKVNSDNKLNNITYMIHWLIQRDIPHFNVTMLYKDIIYEQPYLCELGNFLRHFKMHIVCNFHVFLRVLRQGAILPILVIVERHFGTRRHFFAKQHTVNSFNIVRYFVWKYV